MKDIPDDSRVDVLLSLLDSQFSEIRRGEEREQLVFQWTTNLLLVSFGALVALSDRAVALPYPFLVKLLASIMIAIPAMFSVAWMIWRVKRSSIHAGAIDRIRKLLHLFEDGYYGGTRSVYPYDWEDAFAKYIVRRWETKYYVAVVVLMAVCVVVTLWLLL
jgi:hypothetical protein